MISTSEQENLRKELNKFNELTKSFFLIYQESLGLYSFKDQYSKRKEVCLEIVNKFTTLKEEVSSIKSENLDDIYDDFLQIISRVRYVVSLETKPSAQNSETATQLLNNTTTKIEKMFQKAKPLFMKAGITTKPKSEDNKLNIYLHEYNELCDQITNTQSKITKDCFNSTSSVNRKQIKEYLKECKNHKVSIKNISRATKDLAKNERDQFKQMLNLELESLAYIKKSLKGQNIDHLRKAYALREEADKERVKICEVIADKLLRNDQMIIG